MAQLGPDMVCYICIVKKKYQLAKITHIFPGIRAAIKCWVYVRWSLMGKLFTRKARLSALSGFSLIQRTCSFTRQTVLKWLPSWSSDASSTMEEGGDWIGACLNCAVKFCLSGGFWCFFATYESCYTSLVARQSTDRLDPMFLTFCFARY